MKLHIPGYFSGFSSRSDGSASIRFTTNEIGAAEFAQFRELLNSFGTLTFEAETEPGEAQNI